MISKQAKVERIEDRLKLYEKYVPSCR